jgi:hypothetical protein
MRIWIAGISICLLAASSAVAIVRLIPASYASIPDGHAPSGRGAATSGSDDRPTDDAEAPAAINRRSQAGCPECGFIESMRKIEIDRSGGSGARDTAEVNVAGGAARGASGGANPANALAATGYEFTVRFRDGRTTVFTDASAGTWRVGSRVIVIGGSNAPKD